jgi:hypothetical protein
MWARWLVDKPGTEMIGYQFAILWDFGKDEMRWFKQGCIGLCAIRTGSYRYARKDYPTGVYPQLMPGVRCFWKLDDALAAAAKDLNKGPQPGHLVVFAIESKNDIKKFAKSINKNEIDPTSLSNIRLEPYDFATAFRNSKGKIIYWERMPSGVNKNPNLWVKRTKDHTYDNVVYCYVFSSSPYAGHVVEDDVP